MKVARVLLSLLVVAFGQYTDIMTGGAGGTGEVIEVAMESATPGVSTLRQSGEARRSGTAFVEVEQQREKLTKKLQSLMALEDRYNALF